MPNGAESAKQSAWTGAPLTRSTSAAFSLAWKLYGAVWLCLGPFLTFCTSSSPNQSMAKGTLRPPTALCLLLSLLLLLWDLSLICSRITEKSLLPTVGWHWGYAVIPVPPLSPSMSRKEVYCLD